MFAFHRRKDKEQPLPERAAPSGGKKRRAASKKSRKRSRVSPAGDSEDEDEGGAENILAWEDEHLLPQLASGGETFRIQQKDAPESVKEDAKRLSDETGEDVVLLSSSKEGWTGTATKVMNHLLRQVPKETFKLKGGLRVKNVSGILNVWILTVSALNQLTAAACDREGVPLTATELKQRIRRAEESIAMQKKGYTRCDKCHTPLVPHDHPQCDQLMREGDERAVMASTGLAFETCEHCKQLSCRVLPNTPPGSPAH